MQEKKENEKNVVLRFDKDSRRYGNDLTFLIHFYLWTRRC